MIVATDTHWKVRLRDIMKLDRCSHIGIICYTVKLYQISQNCTSQCTFSGLVCLVGICMLSVRNPVILLDVPQAITSVSGMGLN